MDQYVQVIDTMLDSHIRDYFKDESHIREVCTYILKGGKRIRPSIILDIISTLGGKEHDSSVLSIEYIHTASLVVDDLPCMDNATLRRNKECPHIKYGEAVAQVSSVVLLGMAMDTFSKNLELVQYASEMIGIHGASGGQILDLTGKGDPKEIIYKKTGKFFEFCFIAGWIRGGGSRDMVPEIKKLAYSFSMVFQIIDDFDDVEEDQPHNNYVLFYGKEKASEDVRGHLSTFRKKLEELKLTSLFFDSLVNYFVSKL
jgi:geranylgeranyl diphosphate synthase type II